MGNTGKNEDYVDKIAPNFDGGKLLVVHYDPGDKGRESWLTVAGEGGQKRENGHLCPISIVRGASADQIYALLTGKNSK